MKKPTYSIPFSELIEPKYRLNMIRLAEKSKALKRYCFHLNYTNTLMFA